MEGIKVPKRLSGSVGTGEKILKNLELFNFKFNNIEENTYAFDVKFGNQDGWLTIRAIDEKITDVTLDCSFPRPLGAYNDKGLYKVAEYVLEKCRREKLI